MLHHLHIHLSTLLDWFLPPRGSDLMVRSLTGERLAAKALYDGTLPYHDEEVKALVWELKYHGNPLAAALAGEHLAEILLAAAADELGTPLLLPVPMHRARRRKRGHNQTELLCESSLFHLGEGVFCYRKDLLARARDTQEQQGLQKHIRLHNVKNSMVVTSAAQVAGRVCVVVDDVATTGATFAEARRALTAAGARKVVCIALARS
ncbi:hypothetical protein HYS79_02040 [Patescibacteria group bacterium]|nr:hypothetical protein [Patescibacteria group bacterium]